MKNSPTDYQVLKYIYTQYYDEFVAYSKEKPNRTSKIFVPVDLINVAKHFKVDVDIIFGRFYYYLNKKYGYKEDNGTLISLYAKVAGSEDSVNFPLLAAAYAKVSEENQKNWWVIGLSLGSLVVSVIAILISIFLN